MCFCVRCFLIQNQYTEQSIFIDCYKFILTVIISNKKNKKLLVPNKLLYYITSGPFFGIYCIAFFASVSIIVVNQSFVVKYMCTFGSYNCVKVTCKTLKENLQMLKKIAKIR